MKMYPPFPKNRLSDPKRGAEFRVYQELAGDPAPGLALYGAHAGLNTPEVDFAVWLEQVAHFGIEVKGGLYTYESGAWYLHTANGKEAVPCPLTQAWDAAISIRQVIKERLNRRIFVYAVLLFTDMDPDPIIQELAEHSNTSVLWGVQGLIKDLAEVGRKKDVFPPPTAAQTIEEAKLIVPGLDLSTLPPAAQPEMNLKTHQMIIQQANTVNTYTTGEPDL